MTELEQQEMAGHYTGLGINRLSSQEEAYVLHRVRGINALAAVRAVGYPSPQKAVAELATRDDIQTAIAYFREISRQQAISAGAMEFTKDDATALYLEAHAKSANATEEIKAVDSLVKLHGLATPEKVEVEVTTKDQIQSMSDDDLLKLAGYDIHLSPDQYAVEGVE